jgi:6-phosphogluconolactonase (cycloisomerase 2 family)
MKLSRIGRLSMALVVSVAMGLGMTACGGGTIGYMWVLGTQYNQIAGFKIDDFSGNLTNIVGSPFSSGGTNPVSVVVKPGGRYIYVVNAGTSTTAGNIAEFSVGGDGILTFQAAFTSQGGTPVWEALDSSGNFLYVLDRVAPSFSACNPVGSPCGDITVFSIASDTGRLSLVPNAQLLNTNGTQLTYFPVGTNPIMAKSTGGCLMTVNSADNTVSPYTTNGSTGQLTLPTGVAKQPTGAIKLTSINTGGSFVYLTDSGSTTANPGGLILPYTVGSNCALNTLTGGPVSNLPLTQNPTYSFTDARNRYLYVLNQSTTNTTNANSTISAFTIDQTNGKLQPIGDANNPYPVGSGPVCMVEDPTSQYVYTSNNVDGSVTGKIINQNTGQLSSLNRGSTFAATGLATCLVVSGNVSN